MTVPPEWGEDRLHRHDRFPVAPLGTLSNVAYLLVGLWASFRGPAGVAAAVGLTALALGSGAFHGTAKVWARELDRAGMHVVFAGLVTFAALGQWAGTPFLMVVMGAAAAICLVYLWPVSLTNCMAAYVVIAVLMGFAQGNPWAVGKALLALGVGYVCWILDQLPEPYLGRWGHPAWHALTAVGILYLYLGVGL